MLNWAVSGQLFAFAVIFRRHSQQFSPTILGIQALFAVSLIPHRDREAVTGQINPGFRDWRDSIQTDRRYVPLAGPMFPCAGAGRLRNRPLAPSNTEGGGKKKKSRGNRFLSMD